MDKIERLVDCLNELAQKYEFDDNELNELNELVNAAYEQLGSDEDEKYAEAEEAEQD